MKFKPEPKPAATLARWWRDGVFLRNDEYQRGESWSLTQRQALVDSVFRRYPIPPLFIQEVVTEGPRGSSRSYYIIDGQQRLLALSDFVSDKWPLLSPRDHKRLKLPRSLREQPAPWADTVYSELPEGLRRQFDEEPIDVYWIEDVQNDDEVRDLFIRLQSGTALTRQQIRDAWPGNIGPFVVHLAGKLD